MKDEEVEDTLTIVLVEKNFPKNSDMLTNFARSSW
jgi:hypothetical protein